MVFVVVAFVLGMGAGYLIWARPQEARAIAVEKTVVAQNQAARGNDAAQVDTQGEQAQVEVPKEVKRYDVPVEDSPVFGSDKAPITIIEFSDYECPYCKSWQNDVLPQIKAKYGDKVRLVYRNFPLYSIHPNAEGAAEAAMCAGEQEKYWEFHDLLFSGQKGLGAQTYTSYAQALGLNADTFKKCVEERRYQKDVKADYDFASQIGVRSTPTFFINGLAVVGAQPFDVFQQIIDLEIAGKIPK
jgi:protein-disulfide isomerase